MKNCALFTYTTLHTCCNKRLFIDTFVPIRAYNNLSVIIRREYNVSNNQTFFI